MTSFRLSVPGNLLLAGEYAVLEEGGLGAAVAVEPRLTVTVFPQDDWEVRGRWVGGSEVWRPEGPRAGAPESFAGRVFLAAFEGLGTRGDERGRRWKDPQPARIEVDTSAFFDPTGRKLGYGSSAALAVGLTVALAHLADRDLEDRHAGLHLVAVDAHRAAQGGAGSGYDVTTSWFGGLGLFVGGSEPRWEPAQPGRLPSLALFPGPELVRTPGSIARYRTWQAQHPASARDFLDASNGSVRALVTAPTSSALRDAWETSRDLGLDLGRRIDTPADLEAPRGLEGVFVKALGAGNETGLVAAFGGEFPPLGPGLTALTISEGWRWE